MLRKLLAALVPTSAPVNDGHDVSHWQRIFPWAWSRAQGHRLAACKATQGAKGIDDQLARNRAEMRANGFRWRGLYHWLTVSAPIAAQLAHFQRVVGALEPGEFIQLDCEESPTSGAARILTVDEIAEAWRLWSAAYPGRVCIYGGASYNGWQADPRLANVPWWLAWYRRCTWAELVAYAFRLKRYRFPWQPVIWQWGGGDEGDVVPGVLAHGGRVDSNTVLRPDVLDALCALTPTAPTPITPTVPQEDDMKPRLIQPTGDAAVFATDGVHAVWAVSGPVIVAMQGAGIWDTTPVQLVPRSALKALTLVGPEPDYTGVDPSITGRTTVADFAPAQSILGTVTVAGDLHLTGR